MRPISAISFYYRTRYPTHLTAGASARSANGRCIIALTLPFATDANGLEVGLFLGIGVTSAGDVVKGGLNIRSAAGADGFWDQLEKEVEGIAGRYALVLSVGDDQRMYFDPVLDLSVVYDPQAQVVASSLLPALTRPLQDNPRISDAMIRTQGCNVGLQNTRDAHILRAIPNHFLDLKEFALHRHWPRGDEVFEAEPDRTKDIAQQISNRLAQVFGALVQSYDCVVPVTGGQDSRNLIAAGHKHLGHVKTFFTHKTNKMSGYDCDIAQMIMERLGLPLQIIDVSLPEISGRYSGYQLRRLRKDFYGRVGFEALPLLEIAMAIDNAPPGELLLRANVMDMLGANQYTMFHTEGRFDMLHALRKLHLEPRGNTDEVSKWGKDYLAWSKTLPANTSNRTYDFAFMEQLLPNTLGARFNGSPRQFYVNPFADRAQITAALSVSPKFRRSRELYKTVLSLADPDLSGIPFLSAYRQDPLSYQQAAAN